MIADDIARRLCLLLNIFINKVCKINIYIYLDIIKSKLFNLKVIEE